MLCCSTEERQASNNIDVHMDMSAREEASVFKLVLLGPGNSGKSTFVKQLRTAHGKQLTAREVLAHKEQIRTLLVDQMQVLIRESMRLSKQKNFADCEITPYDDEIRVRVELILEWDGWNTEFPVPIVEAIKTLWAHPGIQNTWEHRGEQFALEDCVSYYFNEVDRVTSCDWEPTYEDILRVHVQTNGVHAERIALEKEVFDLIDVGGQRNERRKWIDMFDTVSAICYVAALSSCWEVLFEDQTTNGMMEALTLFEQVVQRKTFHRVEVLVFLNKLDVFEEHLRNGKRMGSCFESYPAEQEFVPPDDVKDVSFEKWPRNVQEDFEEKSRFARMFIQDEFKKLFFVQDKQRFIHFTVAIDPDNVERLAWDVVEVVAKQSMVDFFA